jgi:peptide/nickel transport system substrate-binding protein
VNIIVAPPVAQMKEVSTGGTELMPVKSARLIMYPFKTTEKPFDDVRVRQAVNYAIDRDAIIQNVLEGYGVPLHGPFSPGWLGYDPDLKPYAHDPNKAKQLLTDAGYPNGFETDFNISSGVFLRDREIAEAVANQFAQVGITVRLIPTERAKILSDWQTGVFKGITMSNWATGADPDAMLGLTFYKRPYMESDEKLTSLIEQSRRTVDPDQRKHVLQELGRYVNEQAYWIFIHAQDEFFAKRNDVPWRPYPIMANIPFVAYYQVPGS